ncbi:MAG TPA: MFS transporter [Stellaceae bacterium]|nr:MFS transporter [Stellaceae bacterium]
METTGPVINAEELINARISGLSLLVAVFGALVLFVDGFDTQVIAYITPQIAKLWHIDKGMMGQIFSSGVAGLLAGYLVISPIAAKVGQKRMMILATALFGVMSLVTTLTSNVWMLMACRFITGVGLGGALPSAVVMTGEFCPKRWRSTFITMAYIGLSFGQIAAGFVAAALLRTFGWQSVLYVGAILPLSLALAMYFLLPESIDHLVNRAQDRARAIKVIQRIKPGIVVPEGARLQAGEGNAHHVAVNRLFQDNRTTGTLAIWFSLIMNLAVLTVLQSWLPTIFIDSGLKQETAIRVASIALGGGILAAPIIGPLMDRFGPFVVMTTLYVLGGLFTALIGGTMSSSIWIVLMPAFAASFSASGIQKSTNALTVYFYPTALRSTGLGWALGIGRIGAVIGPVVVGYLLQFGWKPSSIFYAEALPMLLGAAAIFIMGRTYGRGRNTSTYGEQRTAAE